MKPVLIALLVLLMACTPEPQNLTVSPAARPFAKLTLKTDRNKAFVALRNGFESNAGNFVVVGTLTGALGFRVFWAPFAGQSNTLFFVVTGDAENSLTRILTEPSPPAEAKLLVRDLDRLSRVVRDQLELTSYLLEPDF